MREHEVGRNLLSQMVQTSLVSTEPNFYYERCFPWENSRVLSPRVSHDFWKDFVCEGYWGISPVIGSATKGPLQNGFGRSQNPGRPSVSRYIFLSHYAINPTHEADPYFKTQTLSPLHPCMAPITSGNKPQFFEHLGLGLRVSGPDNPLKRL